MGKRSASFRLTDEGLALLAALAKSMGISQTAAVEVAIRDAATSRNVKLDEVSTEVSTKAGGNRFIWDDPTGITITPGPRRHGKAK